LGKKVLSSRRRKVGEKNTKNEERRKVGHQKRGGVPEVC